MRSQTAYLVLMMAVMGCFAVLRLNPAALVLVPGNIVVAIGLFIGAAATAQRRPYSLAVGLAGAAGAALGGGLMLAGVPEKVVRLPGHPVMWLLIGVYVAFRLTQTHQAAQRAELAERKARLEEAQAASEAEAPEKAGEKAGDKAGGDTGPEANL